MKKLRPQIDMTKDSKQQSEPYAEPKFMLPPSPETLPPPFEELRKKQNSQNTKV